MENLILSLIIGIVFIVIGILNMRGNVNLLHSYHRDRVKEEDKKPMGKTVGLGMIIIALAIIINGALEFLSKTLSNPILTYVGLGVLIVGLAVGLGLNFYAIKKYNGKIF